MVIILDDTFNQRHIFNDVSYLYERKYRNICKVYDYPTLSEFKSISQNLKDVELICNHRSLRLFNEDKDVIDANEAIQNLFNLALSKSIPRLEFGRDMHLNFEVKTLDKDLFYDNLKLFLDNYLSSQKIELKTLYYGRNHTEIEKLSIIKSFLSKINIVDFENFKKEETIIEGILLIFPNEKPLDIINEWEKEKLSKRQIKDLINKKI